MKPTVTVICLCYNHEKYVLESLLSVAAQTYKNIELIVVDDASVDRSVQVIKSYIHHHPIANFLELSTNRGHCRAFNLALANATGKYVIDLAADDMLLPQRIDKQVAFFESLDDNYGVIFSDTYLINKSNNKKKTYFHRDKQGNILVHVPSGDVYIHLIKKFFFSPDTMMMRKSTLDKLGGYDDTISYEDYDFVARSGRNYHYGFQDEVLSIKRVVSGSQYTRIYDVGKNLHLSTTLRVCRKIQQLNKNPAENKALAFSVRYHLRLSTFTANFQTALSYFTLLKQVHKPSLLDYLTLLIINYRINLSFFYKGYIAYLTYIKKLI